MSPVSNCYQTPEDKRRMFPTVTIPQIYAQARAGANDPILFQWLELAGIDQWPRGLPQIIALHELARAGHYRPAAQYNCDPAQDVADTITTGGDCDQWASVMLAALDVLGYKARLITFGDQHDRFAHVSVATKVGRHWYNLDPKGDQAGLPFGEQDSTYTVFESWEP